ncbi:hypothetical protein CDIK_0237 [Cucumispora dikerogammari]|nr:hypothetical protein CDIK_0237 [Cucumispora dikerogammari]
MINKILFELKKIQSQSPDLITILTPPTLIIGTAGVTNSLEGETIISRENGFIYTIIDFKELPDPEIEKLGQGQISQIVKIKFKGGSVDFENDSAKNEFFSLRKRVKKNLFIYFKRIDKGGKKNVFILSLRPKDATKDTIFSLLSAQPNRAFTLEFHLPVKHQDAALKKTLEDLIVELEVELQPYVDLLEYNTHITLGDRTSSSLLDTNNTEPGRTYSNETDKTIEKNVIEFDIVINKIAWSEHLTYTNKHSMAFALTTLKLKYINRSGSDEIVSAFENVIYEMKEILKEHIQNKILRLKNPGLNRQEIIDFLNKAIELSSPINFAPLSNLIKDLKTQVKDLSLFLIPSTRYYKLNTQQDLLEEVV